MNSRNIQNSALSSIGPALLLQALRTPPAKGGFAPGASVTGPQIPQIWDGGAALVVASNAWAGPGQRRGGGEGDVEKERQTGSKAVPGKLSMGGAAMDNLFLLHLRNNVC